MFTFAEHLDLLGCTGSYVQATIKLYSLCKILNKGKEQGEALYCIVYHDGAFTVQQSRPQTPLGQVSFLQYQDALIALSHMTEEELESLL